MTRIVIAHSLMEAAQIRRSAVLSEMPNVDQDVANGIANIAVAEYLTGVSQACYFLAGNDGDVTPHEILGAIKEVAICLGLDQAPRG